MNTAALRTLMIYAIVLPLAVFIGWIVAGDMTRSSFATLSAIIFVLLLPVLLKFHYPVLIFSWNTFITVFFLPGQPALWMIMGVINLGIAILNRIIQKRPVFISAPPITMALLVLAVIVLATAQLSGGMGVRALGSSIIGGKGYYQILSAIIGYFAIASWPIPPQRAKFYVGLFFLAAITAAVSSALYWAGPSFYFLFALFPIGFAQVQAGSEMLGDVSRIAGFGVTGAACIYYLLSMNGLRGLLAKWWRPLLLLVLLPLTMLDGFRTTIVLIGLTLITVFVTEGLARTVFLPALLLIGGLGFMALVPLAPHLPNSIQRSLSFVPGLKVNPWVKYQADSSTEWRVMMWKAMAPDLPKYVWLGKGYALNPTDMYLVEQSVRRSRLPIYHSAIVSGNYHNGFLSVYVPFGGPGILAFLGFLAVALRALYLNFRWGRPELKIVNQFLFAHFLARIIFFFVAFGAITSDLYVFCGLVGLSVALNHGVCRKPAPALASPVRLRGSFVEATPQPRPA